MQLTKAEEQVMRHLWDMGEGIVKDIRDRFDDPKPVRNTVSTVLRILEKKEFVSHKAYGNVHVYYPLVSKEEYSKSQLFGLMKSYFNNSFPAMAGNELMKSYFNNSFPAMASFFAREKDLSIQDLERLMEETKKELSKK